MKSLKPKFILLPLFLVLLSACFTSCHVHHPGHRVTVVKHKRIPPGHAKKISGDRSARRHAPGHRR